VPIWGASEDNCDSQSQHKANLEKIWGKKNWDAKFVKLLTRTLQD
jgi:hypothetical protein